MKKILFAIAMVLMMGFGATAQYTDGFFSNDVYNRFDDDENAPGFSLPSSHFADGNQNAPLGSGLLILTALGGAYAVARKKQ